jgi:hypothetical protein
MSGKTVIPGVPRKITPDGAISTPRIVALVFP